MKTKTLYIGLAVAALILAASRFAWGAEIVGGYVDTLNHIALVAYADGVAVAVRDGDVRVGQGGMRGPRGGLYVVDPDGTSLIAKKGYRDRAGRFIAPPADRFDKIVYRDRFGEVVGVIGASPKELSALLKERYAALKGLIDSPGFLMEGLPDAASVLKEADELYESDRREIFLATVGLRAGRAASGVIEGIMRAPASAGEVNDGIKALFGMRELAMVPSSLEGIGYVAQGGDGDGGTSTVAQGGDGDGGTSLVAQGGDGDGGTSVVAQEGDGDGGTSTVAQGGDGDGGTSLVAQGGDGDGGVSIAGVIIQGGEKGADVPLPRGMRINATCRGTVILLK